ncbi:MAG: hypothetical protein HOP13_04880 [Alphaproteobacteria bacterium]|nr:hypothetical protein [Alphaproteobacteria bacterium]
MHEFGEEQSKRRRKRVASIAFAVCLSAFATGCAHIDGLFASPEQAEPKQRVRKPAPAKAVAVTPEQRAEAKALQATALDQIGRGAIGPATSNLTQAAKLDPTNNQIRRDLVRANRMRSAVGAGEASMPRTKAD